MSKQIEVILEGFGYDKLVKTFDSQCIRGKNIDEVMMLVLNQDWSGQNAMVRQSILRQVDPPYKQYIPEIGMGGILFGDPIKFTPARKDDIVDNYIQPGAGQSEQLRIAIAFRQDDG